MKKKLTKLTLIIFACTSLVKGQVSTQDAELKSTLYHYIEKCQIEDSTARLKNLTQQQKSDIFFAMIENPEKSDAYFVLFEQLINSHININKLRNQKGMRPIETALFQGEETPTYLLLKNGAKIPKRLSVSNGCDNIEVSPLLGAINTENYTIIEMMLKDGIKPDSLCYEAWFELDTEMQYLLFNYAQDSNIQLEEGSLLDYIIEYQHETELNIEAIKNQNIKYAQLVKSIEENNDELTKQYIEDVFDFFIRYGYKNGKFNPYIKNKIETLILLAIKHDNEILTRKLFEPEFQDFFPNMANLFSWAPENFCKVMSEQNWLDNICQASDNITNPYLQDIMLKKGCDINKISINTRNLLIYGKSNQWLKQFYKYENAGVPDIFNSAANLDFKSIDNYLLSNKNPFITDGYGLSLIELMMFTGMEKQVLQILDQNKYIPFDKESIFLALRGGNEPILQKIKEKTDLNSYKGYLYGQAVLIHDTNILNWLTKNNFSSENCLENGAYEVANKAINSPKTLMLLLGSGLPANCVIFDKSMVPEVSRSRHETVPYSLLNLAILNHKTESLKILLSKLADSGEHPDSTLMHTAAAYGTPEMIQLLIDNKYPLDLPDKHGITPIEYAVRFAPTENVIKLVNEGANYKRIVDQNTNYKGIYAIADLSGNLTTLNYLASLECYYTPYIVNKIKSYISFRENEKAIELIKDHTYLPIKKFLREAYWKKNKQLTFWLIDNFSPDIAELTENAVNNSSFWFLDYCFSNEVYAKQISDYKDEEGNSYLHLAIMNYNFDMMKYLLENGLNPSAVNKNGYTPHYFLTEHKSFREKEEAYSLLNRYGGKTKISPSAVQNAFFDAVKEKDTDKAERYLKEGADPNLNMFCSFNTDSWNRTEDTIPPLYYSLTSKNETLTELLLLYGANPNAPCRNEKLSGRSPLYIAFDQGLYKAARMLIYKGADLHFIPETGTKNSCETKVPLIELLKNSYSEIILNCIPGSETPFSQADYDSLTIKALKTEDKKLITKIIDEKGERYLTDQDFLEVLYKECSPEFQIHMLNTLYDEEQLANVYRLKAPIKYGSNKIANLLASKFQYKDTLPKNEYYHYDPMEQALLLGSRMYSLNKSTSSFPSQHQDKKLTKKDKAAYADIVNSLLKYTDFYEDSSCFVSAVEGRFTEAAISFLKHNGYKKEVRLTMLDIIKNNNSALKSKLKKGLSPNAHLYHFSLLACASWANNTEAAKTLIEKGAALNASGFDPNYEYLYHSPEFWAITAGNIDIIKMCQNLGASFLNLYLPYDDDYYSSAFTLLMIQKDKRDAFKWLLDNKIIHNAFGNNIYTLLTHAIVFDDPDLMHLLFQYPPHESYFESLRDHSFYAPSNMEECIASALYNSSEKCFLALVNNPGAKLPEFDEESAFRCENLEIIHWLLLNGVEIKSERMLKDIIHRSIKENNIELLEFINNEYKNPSVSKLIEENNYLFRGTLQQLVVKDSLGMLKKLYECGLKIPENYLSIAIENKSIQITNWLLETGNPWITGKWERTYCPDITKDYTLWKRVTEKIIEVEQLPN